MCSSQSWRLHARSAPSRGRRPRSAHDITVPAGRQALVKTDLSIAIPPNTYARIAPRSGLALKKMIDVGAGVIDFDYRGPVGVVLFNHGGEDFKVAKGDRVAQLILERICMAEVEEVRSQCRPAPQGLGGCPGVPHNDEKRSVSYRHSQARTSAPCAAAMVSR